MGFQGSNEVCNSCGAATKTLNNAGARVCPDCCSEMLNTGNFTQPLGMKRHVGGIMQGGIDVLTYKERIQIVHPKGRWDKQLVTLPFAVILLIGIWYLARFMVPAGFDTVLDALPWVVTTVFAVLFAYFMAFLFRNDAEVYNISATFDDIKQVLRVNKAGEPILEMPYSSISCTKMHSGTDTENYDAHDLHIKHEGGALSLVELYSRREGRRILAKLRMATMVPVIV